MRIGLAAYSFPWRCGFAGKGSDRVCPTPYTAHDLLDLAAHHGLGAVEFPLQMLPDLAPPNLASLRAHAERLGLSLIADSAVVDIATLEQFIPAASALGIPVMRVMISNILEGARATFPGGWQPHFDEIVTRLRYLRPLAEQHNVCLAPENHQDATSEELLLLCDAVGGNHIGITLDVVNPLAVGEHLLDFARALGPRIRNVHLKDYQIYPSPSGYRLVRCALGDGVLDPPMLRGIQAELSPDIWCNIELAALYARHIRLLEDDWWQGFGPRDIRAVIPALRLAASHPRPTNEDWRTPWEQGAPHAELAAYEDDQLTRSVAYLKSLELRA